MLTQFTSLPAQSTPQAQLAGLKSQRSALMDELMSLTIRRDLVTQQTARATGQSAAQLQEELRKIDAQVKSTTSDLDRVNEAVRKAASALPGAAEAPSSLTPAEVEQLVEKAVSGQQAGSTSTGARIDGLERMVARVSGIAGVGFVVALVFFWRWAKAARRPDRIASSDTMRLEQLQRAVDVIAVEVERISEAQRFVAKTVAEERRIPE
jgi:hypothetical protein